MLSQLFRPASLILLVWFAIATASSTVPAIAQDAEAVAPKVSIAAAVSKELKSHASFIGRGEAVDKVDIVARVDGFLEEISVKDGSEVSPGDLLFRIERESYAATAESKEADLDRANADLDLAKLELDRKQTLFERGASPESERDVALANEKVAEANIKSAQAAIRQAQLDLSYTEISAPFAGRVGRINQSIGDTVGPGSPSIVTLVRESPMYVTFSISEKQLIGVMNRIEAAGNDLATAEQKLEVFVQLQNGDLLDEIGELVFIDNRIDPATGTISLRAQFENEKRLIIDGGFVTIQIESPKAVKKLLIPLASVQRDQKGTFVLVVNQQQIVEQRYVTIGEQIETSVIVSDGLREGETVIVEGLQRVRPGVPVDPVLAAKPEE